MSASRVAIAVLCLISISLAQSQTLAQNIRVIPANCHDVKISQQGDVLDIRTTGKDPFLVGDLIGVGPNDLMLEMEYFASEGVRSLELFLGPPFVKQSRTDLPPIPDSETWETYKTEIDLGLVKRLPRRPEKMRLDLGKQPGIRLQIRGLRLRPISAAERRAKLKSELNAKEREIREAQISRYLKQRFADRIETVVVTKDKISLAGKKLPSGFKPSDIQIMECPPWTDIADARSAFPVEAAIQFNSGSWNTTVPRYDGTRDRLHSSWRISNENRLMTARRFPTSIQTIGTNYVSHRPVPENQKGLGGLDRSGPIEELPDLGITAVTVNILLSPFLVDRPGPGRELISITPSSSTVSTNDASVGDSGPVYFNTTAFKPLDVTMNFARKNNIVVSAILLIPAKKEQAGASLLVHPENDGGKYSMPNLTDPQSAQIYAYVLNRVARRYSNPSKAPGGITNWIAHNEVDHHYQWTNMGIQPRAVVLEDYYRSMRMIYNAARQYNPHARVFASLTHNWMVNDDGKGTRLSPREVLVSLQRYSILEGDFDWGVAYHPYAQSLFAPTAWNDTKITQGLDTPLITIQNIEVLEKFLAHRLMLGASRQPRPILLSEQGFHTDTYEATDQANQAGSLAYAMKKIAKMPTVESFHYHRWIDHPKEGGLKMGLRTLPAPGKPYGDKKQAWHVYQAIGTAREEEATRSLPGP